MRYRDVSHLLQSLAAKSCNFLDEAFHKRTASVALSIGAKSLSQIEWAEKIHALCSSQSSAPSCADAFPVLSPGDSLCCLRNLAPLAHTVLLLRGLREGRSNPHRPSSAEVSQALCSCETSRRARQTAVLHLKPAQQGRPEHSTRQCSSLCHRVAGRQLHVHAAIHTGSTWPSSPTAPVRAVTGGLQVRQPGRECQASRRASSASLPTSSFSPQHPQAHFAGVSHSQYAM